MKKFIFTSILAFFVANVFSQTPTYVSGYYRANGTYVSGYYRTTPNNTVYDNYSTYPNVNPFTGTRGSIHYSSPSNNSYYIAPSWQSNSSYNSYYTPSYYSTPSYYPIYRSTYSSYYRY